MDKDDVLFGDGGNDLIYGDGNNPGGNSVVWTLPENHGNDTLKISVLIGIQADAENQRANNRRTATRVANEHTYRRAA